MLQPPVSPVVVRVVEEPTRETSVADILLGAVGLVGAVLLAALVVGVLAGGVLYLVRTIRTRSRGNDGPPSILPTSLPR